MVSMPPPGPTFTCGFCGQESRYALVGTLHGFPRTTGPMRQIERLPRGYECTACGSENHLLHTRGEWHTIDEGPRRAG